MNSAWLEFLAAALVIELTPGPNMSWLALLSAQEGRIAGLRAVLGIAVGLSLLAVASALGASAMLAASPVLYEALRWAGILFLVYLAWEAWVGSRAGAEEKAPETFFRAVLINLLNPKAATVFLTLIPRFSPAAGSLLALSAVYVAIATTVHLVIVATASSLHAALSKPAAERTVRRIFAVLLVLVAIWMFASTGR